jgi:hypothetical protein
MPARMAAGNERIEQGMDIDIPLGLDPHLGLAGIDDVDLVKCRQSDRGAGEPRAGRGQRIPGETEEARDAADHDACEPWDGQDRHSTMWFLQV